MLVKNSMKKFINLSACIAVLLSFSCLTLFASIQTNQSISVQKQLKNLEKLSGGRIGVFAINTQNNQSLRYHSNQRFPVCSTGKIMSVAAILKQSMSNPNLLQQKIYFKKEDVVIYSPITQQHIADGMTITELCDAAIRYSDNTAINLLIKELGGPKAATAFARSIGDNTFRLDRVEPELNTAIPGDSRDTSTPAAMAKSFRKLILGNVLAPAQREQLIGWLKNNTTGDTRIRAGVPIGWIVGDKTGTGDYGTTNDIAIIWPPKSAPLIVAIYFTQFKKNAAPQDKVISSATRILVNAFAITEKRG